MLKSASGVVLFLATINSLLAQSPCGTQMNAEFKEQFIARNHSYEFMPADKSSRGAIQYVPIQYHIVGDDNGRGYFPLEKLLTAHCELNEAYAPAGIQFYLYDAPRYHNNDAYYNFASTIDGYPMFATENVNNVCNVYLCQNPGGVCGYAFYPGSGPSGGGAAINKSCFGPGYTTIAHELGHYFGLPHTFNGWEGRTVSDAALPTDEMVDGSNCSSAGDYFCDTPADFLMNRWSCPYTGFKTDYHGDPYTSVLDESLYMSYSLDGCQNKFSNDQMGEINWVLVNQRPYLLTYPLPSFIAPDTISNALPVSGTLYVNPTLSTLSWDAAPNATHYEVMLSKGNTFTVNDIDTLVDSNFISLVDLTPGINYYWKIRPLTLGYVCGNFSPVMQFSTSAITTTAVVLNPLCNNEPSGYIIVKPHNGLRPYSYNWSNGATDSLQFNLSPGNYTVTVSDAVGAYIVVSFHLNNPSAVVCNIQKIGSNLQATTTGGSSPFTFLWSDGNTNYVRPIPSVTHISCTVTDRWGCSTNDSWNAGETSFLPDVKTEAPLVTINEKGRIIIKNSLIYNSSVELGIFDLSGKELARQVSNQSDFTMDYSLPSHGVYLLNFKYVNARLQQKILY